MDKNRFEHAKRIIHKMEPLQIDNRAAANSTYPKGGKQEVEDLMLTRYACFLIAQYGDSKNLILPMLRTALPQN